MNKVNTDLEHVLRVINQNIDKFNLPKENKTLIKHFPKYLKKQLDNYEQFFEKKLNPVINEKIPFSDNKKDVIPIKF